MGPEVQVGQDAGKIEERKMDEEEATRDQSCVEKQQVMRFIAGE